MSYISWTLMFYPVSLPRISQFIFRTSEFILLRHLEFISPRLPEFIFRTSEFILLRHLEFISPRLPEFISGPMQRSTLCLWILTCVRTTAEVSYISWTVTFYPVSLPRLFEFIVPRLPEFISGSMQREHFVLVDPDLRQDDG
ncbi:hypothetical protein J8L98_23970 [Pseudoalteromonas sp. MMG013]|uniref:hypothetical protein n=1 Tax=Pseudoalteromonas sp. MMG013 TaxID=2822687 RepID=UPI001B36AEB3|nr:hypothetical protein [Pseudoalteromonas sp. MMG013]MBQ4864746.1 hypothetical protein [Pseudoalteromonas sp. MMG013]